MGNKMGAL